MSLPVRTTLVTVDSSIPSCYSDGHGGYKPLASLTSGKLTPSAAAALLNLHKAVLAAGSLHRVTDCWRSYDTQKAARAKYDGWVNAGKPPVDKTAWNKWAAERKAAGLTSLAFDAATMKADYVAAPGYSNHEAGMAIDDTTGILAFPGLPANKQLDKFWEIAIPLGWTPIIKDASEGVSENWHFDFWGEWARVKKVYGYSVASMCGHLDLGIGVYGDDLDKLLQAQLHRAGVDVGPIDGAIGPKTKTGAKYVGINADAPAWDKLFALPSSGLTVIWSSPS